jgi:hypothetical protein
MRECCCRGHCNAHPITWLYCGGAQLQRPRAGGPSAGTHLHQLRLVPLLRSHLQQPVVLQARNSGPPHHLPHPRHRLDGLNHLRLVPISGPRGVQLHQGRGRWGLDLLHRSLMLLEAWNRAEKVAAAAGVRQQAGRQTRRKQERWQQQGAPTTTESTGRMKRFNRSRQKLTR